MNTVKNTNKPTADASSGIVAFIKANTAVAIILGAGVLAGLTIAGALAFSGNTKSVDNGVAMDKKVSQHDVMGAHADNKVDAQATNNSDQASASTDQAATGSTDAVTPSAANVVTASVNQTPAAGSTVETAGSTTPSTPADNNGSTPVTPTPTPAPTPDPTPVPTPTPTPTNTNFTGGRVSLTFDDGVVSIWQNALPLLHQYNFKSTQYLISDTLKNNAAYNDDNGTNMYMTADEAKQFYAADTGVVGTELAAHTMHHCSLVVATTTDDATNCLTNLTAEQQAAQNDRELNQSRIDLRAMFPDFTFNDLASPYGAYDAASIAEIKADNYASHRSTDAGFNAYGQVDPYNIVVQNVEKATTVAQVNAWVDQAISTNTWLVLVYHDVADTSTGAAAGDYGVSKIDLDAQLAYIKSKNVPVVTVNEALAENAQAIAGTN